MMVFQQTHKKYISPKGSCGLSTNCKEEVPYISTVRITTKIVLLHNLSKAKGEMHWHQQ